MGISYPELVLRVVGPENLILRVLHPLMDVGPELLVHGLNNHGGVAGSIAAIVPIEFVYEVVRGGPLVMKVPPIGLLSKHLSPIGDVLGVLINTNDHIVALKGEVRIDLFHRMVAMLELGVVVPIALEICVQIAFSCRERPVSAVFMLATEVSIWVIAVVPPPDDAEEVKAVTREVNHRSICRFSMLDAMLSHVVRGGGGS